ncbi:MAG: gliding motility lipoprotein GldD [Bacteroidia bacterium]
MSKRNLLGFVFLSVIGLSFTGCDDEDDIIYSPKPRGYFRIELPAKEYRLYDSICPYSFELPLYAHITQDRHKGADPCWLNIEFPKFKATVHLTYKDINHNLNQYLEDSRDFAVRHEIKATALDETVVIRDSSKVYGMVYDIAGNTASSVQFYLTDSTTHFLRGSLSFYCRPNADSLKLIIDFIRKDIVQLVKTCKWKTDSPSREIKQKAD